MKKLLVLALALSACGGLETDFRNASPSKQGIQIQVPPKGQALESSDVSTQQQALLNAPSFWYGTTVVVTKAVNGWTWFWLAFLDSIVDLPPTTVDATHAVWGPGGGPLDQQVYRFTVTKVGAAYDYTFEAKDKHLDDSAWVTVISGTHTPGGAMYQGEGTFTIDFDAAQKLPNHDASVGKAVFTYGRKANLDVNVRLTCENCRDGNKTATSYYAFAQAYQADGLFQFQYVNAQNESFAVESRWHQDGSGRSDVDSLNADGSVAGTINECWGTTFLSTYYKESWNPFSTYGDPASCTFSDAQYASF